MNKAKTIESITPNNKTKMNDFLAPFRCMSTFLQGVLIVNKLYCKTKQNFSQVHKCIHTIVAPITITEATAFALKVVNYPEEFTANFFINMPQFEKDIYAFAVEKEEQTKTLESSAERCSYCPNESTRITKWFRYSTPKWATDATLYDTHRIEKLRIQLKQCIQCDNFHYISYSINSDTRRRLFFKNATELPFFQLTNETVFSKQLLDMLMADILFKQASFLGFANSYNFLNSANFKSRYSLDSRRLTEVFYMYQILKFKIEYNIHEITESNIILLNRYFQN